MIVHYYTDDLLPYVPFNATGDVVKVVYYYYNTHLYPGKKEKNRGKETKKARKSKEG